MMNRRTIASPLGAVAIMSSDWQVRDFSHGHPSFKRKPIPAGCIAIENVSDWLGDVLCTAPEERGVDPRAVAALSELKAEHPRMRKAILVVDPKMLDRICVGSGRLEVDAVTEKWIEGQLIEAARKRMSPFDRAVSILGGGR